MHILHIKKPYMYFLTCTYSGGHMQMFENT